MSTKKERMITSFMELKDAEMTTISDHKIVTYTHTNDLGNTYGVAHFAPDRSIKPRTHFRYPNIKMRDEFITNTLKQRIYADIKVEEQYEAERKKRAAKYLEGAILYSSWGYEQTNIDFFLITKRKGVSVTLQPIGSKLVESNGYDTGKVMPDRDRPIGEPINRRISKYGYINADSVRSCQLHDGRPKEYTRYH